MPARLRIHWKPVVLMYHGFSDGVRQDDPYDLFTSAAGFQSQLDHLLSHRWTPLSLSDYLTVTGAGGRSHRSFLVTIDDAMQSVVDVGLPLLFRAQVPAVMFAPAGLLGGCTSWLAQMPDEPIVSADALAELHRHGLEIGVHGWDHASMAGMTDADLLRNTVDARAAIADATGRAPRAFAYPFGDYDDRALRAVARAGYEVAFSVYTDGGRHALSRSDVKPRDSIAAFRCKLLPRYRVVWRAAGVAKPVRRFLRATAQRVGASSSL